MLETFSKPLECAGDILKTFGDILKTFGMSQNLKTQFLRMSPVVFLIESPINTYLTLLHSVTYLYICCTDACRWFQDCFCPKHSRPFLLALVSAYCFMYIVSSLQWIHIWHYLHTLHNLHICCTDAGKCFLDCFCPEHVQYSSLPTLSKDALLAMLPDVEVD